MGHVVEPLTRNVGSELVVVGVEVEVEVVAVIVFVYSQELKYENVVTTERKRS